MKSVALAEPYRNWYGFDGMRSATYCGIAIQRQYSVPAIFKGSSA